MPTSEFTLANRFVIGTGAERWDEGWFIVRRRWAKARDILRRKARCRSALGVRGGSLGTLIGAKGEEFIESWGWSRGDDG